MSDNAPAAPLESVDDDSEPLRLPHGPLRRNAPLLIGVIVVMLIGPSISRLLTNYRGIVLDVQADKMLVGWEVQPPKWLDAIEIQPGAMVEKDTGTWLPVLSPRTPADHDLVKLFDRWMLTYTGTIVRIIDPTRPGGAHTAVVALDTGAGQLHVPLMSSTLDGAAVGRRVHKMPKSWDPGLTDDPVPMPAPDVAADADPVREATLGD